MIFWTKASQKLPRIDTEDQWNKEQEVSNRLLVAFVSSTGTKSITFGTYYHKTGNWSLEGYLGKFEIIAWSYADFPSDNFMKIE